MCDLDFKGPFSVHIKNHVQLKQTIGYKYQSEAAHLLRFSLFVAENIRQPQCSPKKSCWIGAQKRRMNLRVINVQGLL